MYTIYSTTVSLTTQRPTPLLHLGHLVHQLGIRAGGYVKIEKKNHK